MLCELKQPIFPFRAERIAACGSSTACSAPSRSATSGQAARCNSSGERSSGLPATISSSTSTPDACRNGVAFVSTVAKTTGLGRRPSSAASPRPTARK